MLLKKGSHSLANSDSVRLRFLMAEAWHDGSADGRKFRETRLYQVAPISTNMILSYIAEHVLGLPRPH